MRRGGRPQRRGCRAASPAGIQSVRNRTNTTNSTEDTRHETTRTAAGHDEGSGDERCSAPGGASDESDASRATVDERRGAGDRELRQTDGRLRTERRDTRRRARKYPTRPRRTRRPTLRGPLRPVRRARTIVQPVCGRDASPVGSDGGREAERRRQAAPRRPLTKKKMRRSRLVGRRQPPARRRAVKLGNESTTSCVRRVNATGDKLSNDTRPREPAAQHRQRTGRAPTNEQINNSTAAKTCKKRGERDREEGGEEERAASGPRRNE